MIKSNTIIKLRLLFSFIQLCFINGFLRDFLRPMSLYVIPALLMNLTGCESLWLLSSALKETSFPQPRQVFWTPFQEMNQRTFSFLTEPVYQTPNDLTYLDFFINKSKSDIRKKLSVWFRETRRHDFQQIEHLYSSSQSALTFLDKRQFLRDTQKILPKLRPFFTKAATHFSLPWKLLAAVAYQESHWDNEAKSFTGVKGIMMLTKKTASHLGIKDREDLSQSIWGGAKYLRWLLDNQPRHLPQKQQWALALAAYNVGPAHMQDAKKLIKNLGGDPTSWTDIKRTLPLLSQPEFHQHLAYGNARWQEPVDFTHRVLGYYELLHRH